MPPWDRLIRFESGSRTLYGQPVFSTSTTASNFHEAARAGRLEAQVLNAPNGIFGPGLEVSSETVKVDKLLCPLDRRDVPSIRCIVLNYKKHSECNRLDELRCLLTGPFYSPRGWSHPSSLSVRFLQTADSASRTRRGRRDSENLPRSKAGRLRRRALRNCRKDGQEHTH